MIDPFKDYIDIGYVQRPHGTKGEIILDLLFELESFEGLAVDITGSRVPFRIEEYNFVGTKAYVKLTGIESLSDIEFIKGRRVFVDQNHIPKKEILLKSIIDYEIIDKKEGIIGKVIAISNMPLQRMLHIENEDPGEEILIPYHPHIIQNIDHLNKKIFTILPEGFL